MEKIVIVDGNSIMYKAYADIPTLLCTENAEQEHLSTSAIYGFLKILGKVCGEEKPSHLVVVLQTKAEKYKHWICKNVESESRILPIDLKSQLNILKNILEQMNIGVYDAESADTKQIVTALCQKYETMEKTVLTADPVFGKKLQHITKIMILETKDQRTQIKGYQRREYKGDICEDLMQQFNSLSNAELDRLETMEIETFSYDEDASIENTEENNQPVSMSYEVIEITQENQVRELFQKWKNPETDGEMISFRFFVKEQEEDTNLHSSASGQMFLNFGGQDDAVLAMAVSSQSEESVYWISTENGISRELLVEQLACLSLEGNGCYAGFDVKHDYKNWLEQRKEEFALEDTKRFFDTQIAAYLINPLKNDYEIHDLATEYLGVSVQKWSDVFGKADEITAYGDQKGQLISWKCQEAWIVQQAAVRLKKTLQHQNMIALFDEIETPLTYVLFDMEQEGVMVNPEALKQYGENLVGRIKELEQIIYEEAGEEFNINSPKQLGEILFGKLQLPGGKKTKSGYSTAADVLEKLSEEYPIVNKILEYRQLTKLKSTYADGLAVFIDQNNRIHTSYNQTITATGRLSSTEPNLQNIPMRMELGRQIRKIFIPKEDSVFMDADYSQIELRILAHMSEDEKLIEAYRSAKDIHRITASQVFHTPFDEVTDLQRRNAKAVNFGIVYGISSFGLSQGLSISRAEAAEYIERYFETYPGVKTFLDKLVSEAKATGYSVSMFGRRRPIPELASSNYMQRQFGERVAMNAPIQGTAADIMKIAMVNVWRAIHAAGLKSRMILQVHDEVVIETVKDEVEQVKTILTDSMQNAAQLSVALDIDLHTGNDWYEAK